MHTSTITVAVLPEPKETKIHLDDRDIEFITCRGSGAGGQHRNKTDSAVQATHIPTGIRVRVENERSQHQNKDTARRLLYGRLFEAKASKRTSERNNLRQEQVGSGMRGDKIRTIRQQDNQVTDHQSGKKIRYKDYVRGNWEGLF